MAPFFLLLLLSSSFFLSSSRPPAMVAFSSPSPSTFLFIPGFASSQLRSWAHLHCPFSPLHFQPLDSVWLDSRKVLLVPHCWLKCILLDPFNQTDHPECKSRADTGLSAITEIDPGYITATFTAIWREWVNWLVEWGLDPDHITSMPYDWRLPGSVLDKRDSYFYRLKIALETGLKIHAKPALVLAHSMGNNVFRYFLEWLKFQIPPKQYQTWIDRHIYAYVAVGSSFLGSTEALKATMSGLTFGLPLAEGTARLMCNSFGASMWMLPLSTENVDSKDNTTNESNRFAWPIDVAEIHIDPDEYGTCPTINHDLLNTSSMDMNSCNGDMNSCNGDMKEIFSATDVADGTFFQKVKRLDEVGGHQALYQLESFFLNDTILNALTPWLTRPPIRNVFCIYGINSKTEVGYRFAPSGKPYPDNWIITDTIYEVDGGSLLSRSGSPVDGSPSPASGDGTSPYNSLAFCKSWLGNRVNITRAPQTAHDGTDVQEHLNVEHPIGQDIIPNMSRDGRVNYITFYEDEASIPGKKTAVWEFDKVNHRNMIRSRNLMRELWLEIVHSNHPKAQRKFMPKGIRYPVKDEDCFWDYCKARCAVPEYCEYRYAFGDVHLGQSCRLKFSNKSDLLYGYV